MRSLDWDKLRAFVDERKPEFVTAGILDDWSWTAGCVYKEGGYLDEHFAFTDSEWGTPGFKAKLMNGDFVEVVSFIVSER